MNRLLSLVFFAITASAFAGDLQLTLPPVVYATPDMPMRIYHDNIVLTETPETYRFEFTCNVAALARARITHDSRHWSITPGDSDVGDHPLAITVKDASGKILEQGKTTLHISPRKSASTKPLRLLIIGDSLTHATVYPNEIARLLATPGNPKFTLLGTHQPAGAQPGVAHEGYGGWAWATFLTKFTPETPGVTAGPLARKATSPFIFPVKDGKTGVFDLNRYFKEHCDSQPPDVVTFLLGINDCFGADPTKPDAKINEVLDNADKLLAAFHKAAPKAILAVGLTTPPNSRQEGFTANYKDKYPRWGWKRIQHRIVQLMLKRLANREQEGIHLVPTELNLDPVDGYPNNNGVHPNPVGYAQIGASFYSWMKSRL
ncbi:MAG: SGNH/GDSL hydrolase family protein [Prosthecobacter sp.]|uniref:SGNH/GDSL hydrolase family protein n=1 Tax=Prosthecobacter sp. TaxID=1965333 RepID=UPI0039026238